MLSDKELVEIREHIDKAQNPLFFYDNDADGFCSYVLLRKFSGKGRGVAVRSHPDVDESYAKKVQELSADYVFVLDRPVLGERFVEEVKRMQIPIVWIDHHEVDEKPDYQMVFNYNPAKKKEKSYEPVSYISYRISGREEDMWISMIGCIADHFLPDFSESFSERWPEMWSRRVNEPFDAYYGTDIGRLGRVIAFALKDSVTHVVQLQNFMIKCKSPAEMLEELEGSKPFAKKYKDIRKKYDLLIERAKKEAKGKLLFFNYGGDLSISSEVSNHLSYLFPNKLIVVAYSSGPITNISIRGDNARKIITDLLPMFEKSSGGGHEKAVGARIQTKDLERFKEEISKRI